MEFEWDEAKAAANLAKHGVSLEEAQTAFDDPLYVDFYDPHLPGENFFFFGFSERAVVFVSYTSAMVSFA